MAKKSSSKKTFKSLFSKSEATLGESTVAQLGSSGSVDRKGSEKKKFKFPGLKIKGKSSSATERAEQVQSLNDGSSADNVSMETDRSSMYATAPRSKGKELSGSDADLSSKPKRFATIHLGMMKKKKKKEESILSKSTFAIDSTGIEDQQAPSDLSQMPLNQSNRKSLSISQPELDTSEIFDIPSPPKVAFPKPEFPTQTPVTVHSEPIQPQPVLNITNDVPRAPIATIPELKLGGNLQPSVNISSNKEVATASGKVEKALSDFTKPKFDSGNNASVDMGNIQTPNTKLEIPISQPAQPEMPLEIKTGANDLKVTTSLQDQAKIDIASALNPKSGITVEELGSNVALDPKMAATNLSNQVESFVSKTASATKSDEFDGKINKTPLIYNNTKSTVDPVAPSLQVSGNYDSIPKTTTILSQSKMADKDEPKTGVTFEDRQPNINNAFASDLKMAATDLNKQVQSSTTLSTVSNVDNASKPANLDMKVTETTTTYSSGKSSVNSFTPSLPVSLSGQSKMPDMDEPKTGVTIEDMQSNISNAFATDPKMAGVELAKQVQSSTTVSTYSNVDNANKPANFNTKVTETTTIYRSEKPSSSLPVSLSSQSKMADKDEPKTGVTIEDSQPNINSAFVTDPKMAAVDLGKNVQSSTTISTISKPASFDTKVTETTTIYSSEKSSANSTTPSLNVSKIDRDISKASPFSSQSKMADQDDDKMYGVLYNSLFPQNFTQEVVSSLLNSPSKLTSEYKTLETVLVTQFESEKASAPLSTSSPEKIEEHLSKFSTVDTTISSYVEEKSPKDAPKTVFIRKVTTYDTTSSNDTKPVVEDGRFAYSEFSTEAKNDIARIGDTVKPAQSPPLLNYAPSQETNSAHISSESKRKVVLVKEQVSDEATASASSSSTYSGDSGCPTPVMERMSTNTSSETKMEEFDMFSVTSGQTDLHEGICSPAYLSVGSDDGSAIYYSAEEDNADDPFAGDATVIHINATKDEPSILEDLAANRTLILREETNVSGEKVFERPIKQAATQDHSENVLPEVMKARNESKVEPLAAPVERVKEFEVVPPFAESIGRKEGQGISQIEPRDTPAVENHAKNEPERNAGVSEAIHERSSVGKEWQITPKFAEEAEERALSADVKESVSERVISGAGGDNGDSVSLKAGRGEGEQVANAAAAEAQNILQITQERRTGPGLNQDQIPDQDQGQDQGQEQPELRQGSLPSSQTPAAFPDPNIPHSDSMSSSYSSLSTTRISLKSPALPPQLDDPSSSSTSRFRKVSLVSDSNGTAQGNDDFRWRNRLEGLQQFKPISDTQNDNKEFYSFSVSSVDRLDSIDGSTGGGGGEKRGWSLAEEEAELRQAPVELERDSVRSHAGGERRGEDEEEDSFTGLYKATLVDLVPESPTVLPPSPLGAFVSPPGTPDDADMDSLVDTLKNMGPSMRLRSLGSRGAQNSSLLLTSSSLPPIVEDASVNNNVHNNNHNNKTEVDGTNGNIYVLPPDIGLKKSGFRDMRSPLELLKQEQQSSRPLQLRASASSSIVMRSSSDSASSPEELSSPPLLNGSTGSRLDHSLIFSSLRSSSVDQTGDNGTKPHRPLFRASSLPDIGHNNDRISLPPSIENGESDPSAPSRFERFSYLLGSSSSSQSGVGEEYGGRISRGPSLAMGSPPPGNSPTLLLSPTGSLERPFSDSPIRMGPPSLLQRSFSGDSGVSLQQGAPFINNFNNININNNSNMHNFQNHFQPQPEPEPERNLLSKYRAFPDAYLTKEKEHGKLNPRPGKMYIFDRPGMCGQRTEIRSDVTDATSWELEETISIRVVRGGWVLYEKPDFKGEKIALDEGDIELTNPFAPLEEVLQNGQMNGQMNGGMNGQMNGQINGQTHAPQTNGEQGESGETTTEERPARKTVIGSIRRAVRDYSVPEISLFPEQNAEGKKVVFRDCSEDARIYGYPVKANSIVINAGLWLVYAQPFFQGVPRVLEVGGYTNPEAWGVQKEEQPYVASLHPLKIGEPRVENMAEPKMVVFEKPYFCGKSRTISSNSRDFMTRMDNRQQAFMHSVGSLKVMSGIWVGYEKEGYRGHQYLLEEGDYQDWRVWGGVDGELRSVRVIRADLTDPLMVMFEQPEEEEEEQEENTFEVTEAIPDVELFGVKTNTRCIQVVSGAWVAYSHVDFSGSQYILEKGFYNNSADWGALDARICSVQPILMVPRDETQHRNSLTLYNEPGFQGQCFTVSRNQEALSDKLIPKSCRVVGNSWVLYENKQFQGNQYVLSEGDYPNLSSMGCPTSCYLRSAKAVPMTLSVPSISLFGLECLEGREITMESELFSLVEEGFNNHILSVRVNTGCWVLCEHSNYRGRQFLLEPIEITNWPKFSSMQTIGSMYPVRQKRSVFRVKNKELGHYLSVQGGVEEMKSGRVVVTPEVEPMSDLWYYQDGLVKNKLSPTMCLQVMGNVEPAAKVVLWSESRQPVQTWTAQMRGLISSLTFPGMVLDVKGGKTYDKSHVVIMPEDDERPSQQWEIEIL